MLANEANVPGAYLEVANPNIVKIALKIYQS